METKIFTTPNWESSPNGNLVWQHFSVSILDFEAFVHKWAEDLQNITFSGFNNNVQFTTEDILDTLRISTEVYLLLDTSGKCFGFYFVFIGSDILYVNKQCIAKNQQGRGYGSRIAKLLTNSITEIAGVGKTTFYGFTTQNPIMPGSIHSYCDVLYPIDSDYHNTEGLYVINKFLSTVPQLEGAKEHIDYRTGLRKNLYGSKLFIDPDTEFDIKTATEQLMIKRGLNAFRGDGLLMIGKLKQVMS